ncbi:MAG: response regulator [Roseburia sp.]|nr:response regulator [Roseburia sp.]
MDEGKRILIVDDSEIDRTILKSIMDEEFQVIEADNGYSALELMLKKKVQLDAIMLDISMPFLDGLNVLQILRENNLEDIPVFMITAEATKENIERASQYNITEFIRKPFNREEILKRVRAKLGVEEKAAFTKADIDETRKYIADLEHIYGHYLDCTSKDKGRDERRAYFMKILLAKCPTIEKGTEYDNFQLWMIGKAAYFCNIGDMLLFNAQADTASQAGNAGGDIHQQHTVLGAELIRLNYSKHCRRFVQICSDMCLHHHERYDGKGFPEGISGKDYQTYTQICGLLERFDDQFFKSSRRNELQFDYVIDQIRRDSGFVSDEVFSLLVDSKSEIMKYYNINYV